MSPSPRIEVADEQTLWSSDEARVRKLVRHVLAAEGSKGKSVSVAFVDDERIAEIHEQFLGVPGATDVVSFPLEDELDALLGEIVVSTDTAKREAEERELPFDREVLLYVVHGLLHLLGYDDHKKSDRTKMHARQEELLEEFLAAEKKTRPGKR